MRLLKTVMYSVSSIRRYVARNIVIRLLPTACQLFDPEGMKKICWPQHYETNWWTPDPRKLRAYTVIQAWIQTAVSRVRRLNRLTKLNQLLNALCSFGFLPCYSCTWNLEQSEGLSTVFNTGEILKIRHIILLIFHDFTMWTVRIFPSRCRDRDCDN